MKTHHMWHLTDHHDQRCHSTVVLNPRVGATPHQQFSSFGPIQLRGDLGTNVFPHKWSIILWSFAHAARRDQVNRARNADHAARTCERFVDFIVKITWLCNYQTWQTHLSFGNWRGAQRFCGLFFLVVLFGCWLTPRMRDNKFLLWEKYSFPHILCEDELGAVVLDPGKSLEHSVSLKISSHFCPPV